MQINSMGQTSVLILPIPSPIPNHFILVAMNLGASFCQPEQNDGTARREGLGTTPADTYMESDKIRSSRNYTQHLRK